MTADRIGVCSWSYQKPFDVVAEEMKKMGISRINLALQPFLGGDRHGAAESAEAQARARKRIENGEWKISSTMISFSHEDYTTIASIRKTGGIVPDQYWDADRELVARAAKLTGEWKVPYMLMHAGFMDVNDKAAFDKYLYRVKTLRDICAKENVTLLLESGQETADELVKFMPLVEGVGINFDPANIIQYGNGSGIEAAKKLIPWIKHMHIKDACAPKVKGEWGAEVPWGDGEVNAKEMIATMERLGYQGAFAIEREAGNDRIGDIALAVKRLLEG